MPKTIGLFTAFLAVIGQLPDARASLIIGALNSEYTIGFDGFAGGGFAPEPAAGQLDSDDWAVTGFSDGAGSVPFGGTATSGDFARGASVGGVVTGGVYGFDVSNGGAENRALGVQPTDADFTSGSFTLRLRNDTGGTITSLQIAYTIYTYNDQGRSSSFNFSHSGDDVVYAEIPALDYTSPIVADTPPAWTAADRNTTLSGLTVAEGASYYLRWTGVDGEGSGSRDEFALDDVRITAVPEPGLAGLLGGLVLTTILTCNLCRTARSSRQRSSGTD